MDHSSSSSSSAPHPMEGLHEVGAPPYLIKIYDMVEDPSTDSMISWSRARNSFIIWDSHEFSNTLLSKFFKTKKFVSFLRQLHFYGFKKVHNDRLEFAHEGFLRGQKNLLRTIKRRQLKGGPCVELGNNAIEGELEKLKSDNNMLMEGVVKLDQEQQEFKNHMIETENWMEYMDSKQQYFMDFFSDASSNPASIEQYIEIFKAKMDGLEIRSQQQDMDVDATTDMGSFLSSAVDKSIDNISSPKVPRNDEYPVFKEYTSDELFNNDHGIVNMEGVVVSDQPGMEVDDPEKSPGWPDIDELEEEDLMSDL